MKHLFQKRPQIHRLFWRVYLHGLGLIVVLAIAGSIVVSVFGGTTEWRQMTGRIASVLAADIVPHEIEQKTLSDRLNLLAYILQANLAIYTVDGKVLASAGESLPSQLDQQYVFSLDQDEPHYRYLKKSMDIRLPKRAGVKAAYLIIDWRRTDRSIRMIVSLGVVLLVIGVMSIPICFAIAKPLERLTKTARKLSDGDLTVRTGMAGGKDQFGTLASAMDEMAGQLERRIRSEKELLANVSHEIRTPLARINVAIELCGEEDATEEEIKNHLTGIAGDVAELDQLLEDVLTTTRLELTAQGNEEKSFILRKEQVDMEAVVAQAKEGFFSVHPDHALKVFVDGKKNLTNVDPALIRRVIDNLLDNAVKYSRPESQIELGIEYVQADVVIEIRDRGIGIQGEDLDRIFDPFFRAEHSMTRGAGGTGLGLTLSKRIVESHDGKIAAIPRDGGGTLFRITLPNDGVDR